MGRSRVRYTSEERQIMTAEAKRVLFLSTVVAVLRFPGRVAWFLHVVADEWRLTV